MSDDRVKNKKARSLKITYSVAFYHIASLGNERKDMFKCQRNGEKFEKLATDTHTETDISIGRHGKLKITFPSGKKLIFLWYDSFA